MMDDPRPVDVVIANLPSGAPLPIQVPRNGSGMGSVGLGDKVDIQDAINTVGELGSLLFERLQALRPNRASVELTLGFSVEAGKLTALIVNGKAEASLTLTMEWMTTPP